MYLVIQASCVASDIFFFNLRNLSLLSLVSSWFETTAPSEHLQYETNFENMSMCLLLPGGFLKLSPIV